MDWYSGNKPQTFASATPEKWASHFTGQACGGENSHRFAKQLPKHSNLYPRVVDFWDCFDQDLEIISKECRK